MNKEYMCRMRIQTMYTYIKLRGGDSGKLRNLVGGFVAASTIEVVNYSTVGIVYFHIWSS